MSEKSLIPSASENYGIRQGPWLLRDAPLAFSLSFVAGFIDTAGFVTLFGLFTAHVTGNLVLAGASVASPRIGFVTARLLALPIFMAAVMFAAGMARQLRRRRRAPLPWLLWGEALGLALFLVCSVVFQTQLRSEEQQGLVLVVAGSAVVAMGIHNSLMREEAAHLLPTTVMTGNLTMFTTDLTTILFAGPKAGVAPSAQFSQAKARMERTVPVLLGFLMGAALGALGVRYAGGWSVGLPIAVLVLLAASATNATSPDQDHPPDQSRAANTNGRH